MDVILSLLNLLVPNSCNLFFLLMIYLVRLIVSLGLCLRFRMSPGAPVVEAGGGEDT